MQRGAWDSQSLGLSKLTWTSDPQARVVFGRMARALGPQMDNLGVHLPIRAQQRLVGVMTFEGYPYSTHFAAVEAILASAALVLADRLARNNGALRDLQEAIQACRTPADPSDVVAAPFAVVAVDETPTNPGDDLLPPVDAEAS